MIGEGKAQLRNDLKQVVAHLERTNVVRLQVQVRTSTLGVANTGTTWYQTVDVSSLRCREWR